MRDPVLDALRQSREALKEAIAANDEEIKRLEERILDLEQERDDLAESEECPVHGSVHGAEAEELRKGVEHIIKHASDSVEEVIGNLGDLLDRVDARDSLACLETIEQHEADLGITCGALVKIERIASIFVEYDEQHWRDEGCPTYTTCLEKILAEARAALTEQVAQVLKAIREAP